MNMLSLGEVADFINGRAFKPEEWSDRGTPIIRIQNLTGTSKVFNYFNGDCEERYHVHEGDILISWSASLDVYIWHGQDAVLNQHIFKVKLRDFVDKAFFYYAAQNALDEMIARIHGATMQHITKDQFDSIQITVPALPEQKRIATQLDKADRLRRSRRYVQELSDSFLQSVFLEMFGNPVTNTHGWDVVELADLVQAFEGGINFNPVPENGPSSAWRVLKISSVTSGKFRPYESKAIAPDTKFGESLIVHKNDLIISRANTTELVGAVCIVRQTPPNVLLPDKLWRIKLLSSAEIDADYLLHVLQLPHTRKIIGELATGTSGSMKNISKDKAGTLRIMLPPKEQQERFSAVVQTMERLRIQQREAERQAEHLFQTVLHRAFSDSEPQGVS